MRFALQIGLVMVAMAAVAAERPAIGLLTEFPADSPSAVREEFRLETERAMQAAGVELVWRNLAEKGSEENFDRLVVIRFRGECASLRVGARRGKLPLGLTHVSNGQVLPFVEIDCQRILEAMYAGEWLGRFRQETVIGRALGRVAAHEIYHVLTGSSTHDNEGLMRPSFDRRDLCGLELAFSRESVRRLKISLGTATAQTALRNKTATDN